MAGGVFFVAGAAAREVRVAELKSNFVASVSHDLKTPLALIQLFAETLELGRVRSAERAQEYYRIINTEARKLTRLIENILDFSRMEAGLRPVPDRAGRHRRGHAARRCRRWRASSRRRSSTCARASSPGCRGVDDRRGRGRAGDREPAGQRDEVLRRVARHRRQRRPRQRSRVRQRRPTTASASRGANRSESSASSTVLTAASAAARRAAASGSPSSTTRCAATAASCALTASSRTAARSPCTSPSPRAGRQVAGPGATAEGDVHEADPGDRGRAADVARSA